MRRNRVNMIQTAEQYEFLHRALVHALTFDCAPVAADQLQNYVSKTGQQQREKQLKQLMSVSQHVVPEERINMARNKNLKNKNRPGADIPAQSPLPGTVVYFLSLAYKEDCPCIVSFQHTHESKDVRMYYPADNQVLSSGDYTVSSFKMDEEMEHCVPRRLVLENRPITNI
ncbi:receptor-type tyrosine-protein phosphatase gamma-like isoform X2 [Dreissena polymorpha]|uniref:receptor-type tyrosine-protein phosphatase gamma-like isoform X2 n=1 Tax=Dreissena polymorpha TaxID=45954 RepID=UPI00226545C5|nr:receptor-type tyrosine-protein phosphatase gamma-like isoform X2 [Dreissena polymorpha]